MADAVMERELIIDEGAAASGTPFSWSAAIVGAMAATAVNFIIIALGAGIGLRSLLPSRRVRPRRV